MDKGESKEKTALRKRGRSMEEEEEQKPDTEQVVNVGDNPSHYSRVQTPAKRQKYTIKRDKKLNSPDVGAAQQGHGHCEREERSFELRVQSSELLKADKL